MFKRHGGAVGWLAFPFMLLFEFFGPLIEVVGYVSMIVLALAGLVPLKVFLVFLAAAVGMGMLLSVNAMLLEELSFGLYARPAQQLRLFAVAVLENFGYRQMNSCWRLYGMLLWLFGLRKHHRWGHINRDGSWQHGQAEGEAVPAGQAADGSSHP